MGLSKVFNYVSHDIFHANLAACGVVENNFCYTHFYLQN